MNLPKKDVDEAVAPMDSQQKIALNEYLRRYAIIRSFGENFCVCADYHLFSADKKLLHPTVDIPETRLMLGMEACFENRTVVLMHHDKPKNDSEAVIKLDFYSVDDDFNISLLRTVSTLAGCGTGGITFHFSSPKIGEYVGLFADFFNYDWFKTLQVSVKSNSQVSVEAGRIYFDSCVFPLEEWGDYAHDYIFPGLGCLYNPDVYPVLKHPNCIFLIIRHVSLQERNAPKSRAFECAVRLPVAVHWSQSMEDYHRCSTMMVRIDQIMQHSDGTDRALVRINTDNRQCVYLLLHMQDNTVLDMCVASDKVEMICIIDSSRDRIVQFVEPPQKTEEKKTNKKVVRMKVVKAKKVKKSARKQEEGTVVARGERGVTTRSTKNK